MPQTPTDVLDRLSQYNTSQSNVPYTFVGPNHYGYSNTLPMALNDVAAFGHWLVDVYATLVTSHDHSVVHILAMTQQEYNDLEEVDPQTLYVIVPEA